MPNLIANSVVSGNT